MYLSPIHNLTLLSKISEAREITYEELRCTYLPENKPGIVQGVTVTFDDDLDTLESMGYIMREGNLIRYVGRR